jgi:hypothetical protein
MADTITRTEYLSFDSVASPSLPAVALNTPAWEAIDYGPLYDMSPPLVGDDVQIPGVAGRLFQPHEEDELTFSLNMRFYGRYQHDNTVNSDPRVGLRLNLDYFRTNVVRGNPGQLRAVTFHKLGGGSNLTGSVIVMPPLQVAFHGPALAYAVLTLKIPAGRLS